MKDKPIMPNECLVMYHCQIMPKNCVYYKKGKNGYCYYDVNRCGTCGSKVAQANAMVLALKDMGFKVEIKGGKE